MVEKIKQKKYFDVKVEVLLPATLIYRVYAEDAQQAANMIKTMVPNQVRHRLNGRKELKLTVYDYGSIVIRYIQNLFGRQA